MFINEIKFFGWIDLNMFMGYLPYNSCFLLAIPPFNLLMKSRKEIL